ncbi:MAG: RNA ligase [Campylobacterota bacterium]|nr:RNA ligase [Campylobacterota bacterium]
MKFNFNKMMDLCNSKDEFRAKEETVDGVDVTIFSYMVSKSDTFDSELAKEFRGTTFRNDTKECICRPFAKFFNVGEKEETLVDNVDWDNAKFFIKHDGSMATPVLINNRIFWKTKNSFFSNVAQNIQKFYDNNASVAFGHVNLKRMLNHFTPIFEYVGPDNRIVLDYEKEELIYLGFRDLLTGEFIPCEETQAHNLSYDQIYNMKGIEGFVIHDGNQMVKAKTQEYVENHRIVSEFNPKVIINATLNDTIDDILAVVSQLGFTLRYYQIQKLRDEVVNCELNILHDINSHWMTFGHMKNNRKEFAQAVNKHVPNELKPFMFLMLDSKDIDNKLKSLVYDTIYKEYKP